MTITLHTEGLIKGLEDLVNKSTCGYRPTDCITEIGLNTEKSPGDLRRLALILTSLKDYQLTLLRKSFEGAIIIMTQKQEMEEKLLYGFFKRESGQSAREENWIRNWNFIRDSEPCWTTVQNYGIGFNDIKANIDYSQQISNRRLCGDRVETMNHVIRECGKLAEKEVKTRHAWGVGKVIHCELLEKN